MEVQATKAFMTGRLGIVGTENPSVLMEISSTGSDLNPATSDFQPWETSGALAAFIPDGLKAADGNGA